MTYEFKMGDRILYHQTRIAYVYKKDRSRVAVIGTRNIDDLIKKERMQEAKLKRHILWRKRRIRRKRIS